MAAPKARPEPSVPEELAAALRLKKNRRAKETWDAFPPSHRREYVGYIEEAKRPETRARRVAQTVAQLIEGKPRNWKYQ